MHLWRMTRLRVLPLDETQLTDVGLVHLKEMNELTTLGLTVTLHHGCRPAGSLSKRGATPNPDGSAAQEKAAAGR